MLKDIPAEDIPADGVPLQQGAGASINSLQHQEQQKRRWWCRTASLYRAGQRRVLTDAIALVKDLTGAGGGGGDLGAGSALSALAQQQHAANAVL
jgi:hypothetical protein